MPLFNVVIIVINEHESNYLLSRCEVTFNSRVKLLLRIVTRQLSYSQSFPGINQQSSHIILLLLPKIHQFQSLTQEKYLNKISKTRIINY